MNILFTEKASRKNGLGQAVIIQFNHGLTRISTDESMNPPSYSLWGSTYRRLPYPSVAYCTLPKHHFAFFRRGKGFRVDASVVFFAAQALHQCPEFLVPLTLLAD